MVKAWAVILPRVLLRPGGRGPAPRSKVGAAPVQTRSLLPRSPGASPAARAKAESWTLVRGVAASSSRHLLLRAREWRVVLATVRARAARPLLPVAVPMAVLIPVEGAPGVALQPLPVRAVQLQALGELVVAGGVRLGTAVLEEVSVVADPLTVPTSLGGPLLAVDAPLPALRNEAVGTRVVKPRAATVLRLLAAGT